MTIFASHGITINTAKLQKWRNWTILQSHYCPYHGIQCPHTLKIICAQTESQNSVCIYWAKQTRLWKGNVDTCTREPCSQLYHREQVTIYCAHLNAPHTELNTAYLTLQLLHLSRLRLKWIETHHLQLSLYSFRWNNSAAFSHTHAHLAAAAGPISTDT